MDSLTIRPNRVLTHYILCHIEKEEMSPPGWGHFVGEIYDNDEIEVVRRVAFHCNRYPGHGPFLKLHKADAVNADPEWLATCLKVEAAAHQYANSGEFDPKRLDIREVPLFG